MTERAKRNFVWILFAAMFVVYFGGGYYFGVIDRPRRHPPVDATGPGAGSGRAPS